MIVFPPGSISLVVGLFTAIATEVAKAAPGNLPNPKNVAAVRLVAASVAAAGVCGVSMLAGQPVTDWATVAPVVAEALTAYFVAAGIYGHTKAGDAER